MERAAGLQKTQVCATLLREQCKAHVVHLRVRQSSDYQISAEGKEPVGIVFGNVAKAADLRKTPVCARAPRESVR
jgi:hypothetical protein